jgi:hypothetical protein
MIEFKVPVTSTWVTEVGRTCTVVVPAARPLGKVPTKWHPDFYSRPAWPECVRGTFLTEWDAHKWAADNIPGHAYSIRWYGGITYDPASVRGADGYATEWEDYEPEGDE